MSQLDLPQLDLNPADYALPDDVEARLLSPALVVHLEHARANIQQILSYADGDAQRWWPHVKTVKIPQVMAELVEAGLRGFKCATVREARHLAQILAERSVSDAEILVAYPLVGPALQHLGQLAQEHSQTRFSVICENPDALGSIPKQLGVFVDVNPGMNRTGVPVEDDDRILIIAQRAGSCFRGLHAYEGHLYVHDLEPRRETAFHGYQRVLQLVEQLQAAGNKVEHVITSGTPTLRDALAYPPFADLGDTTHHISAGTVVYHDLRTASRCPNLKLRPAAVVLTRVVSHPREGMITADAGSKSVAAEVGDPCAMVIGYPGLVGLKPSEEHLPFEIVSGPVPERGTVLMLVPQHVCPTVNLAEEALLVRRGNPAEAVRVAARAHDLGWPT